ncbi:hypothetical protein JVU11DRAFT_4540 [Chiua virens]|nr:hypothetical protein JVU11DRAFT_4540 [Chiua virens]
MSPIRNTARKTTGTHVKLSAALKNRPSQPPQTPGEPSLKRALQSCPPASTSSVKNENIPRPADSDQWEVRPSTNERFIPKLLALEKFDSPPVPPDFQSVELTRQPSSSAPDTLHAAASPSTNTTSKTLSKRRMCDPIYVLDKPICLCTRFATWLESQKHVHDDALLRAVERDGAHFLRLAKAALSFDNALRGHVPTLDDAVLDNPLREHARTLRVFAEVLRSKVAEGILSEELKAAVLRDGEALFRLAVCCLDFDQAIRGSGGPS